MVADNDAPAFLQSADIEEMTYENVVTAGQVWRPQVELITDERVIKSILAKVRTGTALTQNEMDAIDPDKPARGLGKTRHFQDILDEYIGKM